MAFESGRKTGRNEVLNAVALVCRLEKENMRDCCSGCFETDFVEAVRRRLGDV